MSIYYPTISKQHKSLPIYLTSTGVFFEETMISRENGYDDYQWIITVSGEGEIIIENESYHLDSSVGIFIPSHIPHSYKKISPHWITHWISFNGQQLNEFFDTHKLSSIKILNLNDTSSQYRELENIYYLASTNYTKNSLKISVLLYSAIEKIYTYNNSHDFMKTDTKNDIINRSLDYIHENYMKELTIKDIANHTHISPQYLCRLFKQQLNLRPFEYIKQVRINKSKSLLLQLPPLKIEEISHIVGFGNPSYYTKIFKKNEKITPREFIKRHQRGV